MLLQLFTDVSNVLTDSLTNDLSANKNAQQYKTPIGCATCTAINVVDRNAQTCARMEDIGITSLDKSTWWHVDLGGRYNVYNIRIQFKDYGQIYSKYSINGKMYMYSKWSERDICICNLYNISIQL